VRVIIENRVTLEIPIPPISSTVAELHAGETVQLSVRPEAIELSAGGDQANGGNWISGKIAASAYQGSFVEYEITVASKAFKARVANPKGKILYQRGDEVRLNFAAADLVVVPKAVE